VRQASGDGVDARQWRDVGRRADRPQTSLYRASQISGAEEYALN